jgi:hypothetical protein
MDGLRHDVALSLGLHVLHAAGLSLDRHEAVRVPWTIYGCEIVVRPIAAPRRRPTYFWLGEDAEK